MSAARGQRAGGYPAAGKGFVSLGEIPAGIPRMQVPEIAIDPVTFSVIGGTLFAICRQMDITLRNASLSPIINVGKDFSCAIFTEDAQLVAQACNCPGHVGSMHYAVLACLESFGIENMNDGDAFLLNDPYRGGIHLPDITVITPVFHQGRLVMFTGNRAHHQDVGGSVPGSFPMSTEIFEEGIRIPPVRFINRGQRNEAVLDIVLANVRIPTEVEGDIEAQFAANRVGARELCRLMEKYGMDMVRAALLQYMEHSERAFRAHLKIPEGRYEAQDWMDGDGTSEEQRKIQVALTVKGSEVYLDFTGTAHQVRGPINSVFPATASMVVTAFLSLTDPNIMPNHGFYRPIHVKAPEGTLVNPRFPAATVGFPDVTNRIYDVILEALTPVIPERVIASTSGTTTNCFFGGTDPRTGAPYVWYSINSQGGWGGRSDSDGWHNVCFIEANGWDIPVETIEYRYPWRVLEYGLRTDVAGAGRWRGGEGNRIVLTPVDHEAVFTVNGDRAATPPYGVFGGKPGATARCTIRRRNGEVESIASRTMKVENVRIAPGDIVVIEATSGGGYGNPLERDLKQVERDLRDGLVSVDSARRDYGVIVDRETLHIELPETEKLRAAMRKEFEHIRNRLSAIDRQGYLLLPQSKSPTLLESR